MDDADKLLESVDKPEVSKDGETAGEEIQEIGGTKYNMADPKDRANAIKAFKSMEVERSRVLNENKKLKEEQEAKSTPTVPSETEPNIPEEEKIRAKKALGYVTPEDLDIRDYVKDATKEVQRIAKEYGFEKPDDLFKEMIDLNRRVPVEKIELLFKLNHPDLYEKKRAAGIAADKPATPYTERPVKQGLEMPSAEATSFRKGNTVSKAMELIGAKE